MSKINAIELLTERIESSLQSPEIKNQANQIRLGLQTIQSGNFTKAVAQNTFGGIFKHMDRDQDMVTEYAPIIKELAIKHENIRRILAKSITRRGRCPDSAKVSVHQILMDIEKGASVKKAKSQPINKELQREPIYPSQPLEPNLPNMYIPTSIIDRVLGSSQILSNRTSLDSQVIKNFQASLNHIKRDISNYKIGAISKSSQAGDPTNLAGLIEEFKHYHLPDIKAAERFLKLAKTYAETEREDLLRLSLTQYCYTRGIQQFNVKRREARPYLQSFLFLYSRMPTDIQRELTSMLYIGMANYFGTYNISISHRGYTVQDRVDRFYLNLMRVLASISYQVQFQSLGLCIIDLAIAFPWFVYDLINRMKTRGDAKDALQALADALQEPTVFRGGPLQCIQLLGRIDSSSIGMALSRQSLSSADERRLVATALLNYVVESPPQPYTILRSFVQRASADTKRDLAFSILVEPLLLHLRKRVIELKADLITESLGLPVGTSPTEYFKVRATELADLFGRFSETSDPNVKGGYGYNILDTVRLARKWLAERLRGDLKAEIIQFFRSVEGYVTTEQAKLIRDTSLEIKLVSDRTLFSLNNTRLTIEIRNIGEGTADGLELEVFPVEAQYSVEDRYRVYTVDILADKIPIQKEIFIQPHIFVNESLDLSIVLRYNTLKERNKTAELSGDNRTVWLYPETHYVRVRQPYTIGEPATTWFYGRQTLLETMADNLHTGSVHDTSMIVYGLKRAGKTSIVKRFIEHTLKANGLDQTYLPIYADLLKDPRAQRIKADGDFLNFLTQIIVEALHYGVSKNRISFDLSQFRDDFRTNPHETFSFLLEEILKVIEPVRLLIVLDEFSTLQGKLKNANSGEGLTNAVFGFLSNTIQATNQVTFVFTGTYMLLEMMRDHTFDLAKTCTPYMIGFLDENSARQLVVEPVMRDEINLDKGYLEYDPRVVDRIVIVTNRHPYLIQYCCMQLVHRMNTLKHNTVNLNDIASLIDEIVSRPMHAPTMLTLWNEFDTPQHMVLSMIAAKSTVFQSWVEISEIVNTFESLGYPTATEDILEICFSLADAELLEKSSTGETDSYRITIPLYQMWLSQNKPLNAIFESKPSDSSMINKWKNK